MMNTAIIIKIKTPTIFMPNYEKGKIIKLLELTNIVRRAI